MTTASLTARVAAFAALVAAALLMPLSAASASAQQSVRLNGDWAPFNRCPVTNTAMVQADGVNNVPSCVASSSPAGTIKIGNMTPTTSQSDLQFGLVSSSAGFTVVSPQQGAVQSAPVIEPGGLSSMICPSSSPPVAQLCRTLAGNSRLNTVRATLGSAGDPSNFNLIAGLTAGVPIVTLPVKIHLQNPFLGPKCYIGTNANPIVLHPANETPPAAQVERFDGPINLSGGLPSPAGKNSLVLTNASAYLTGLFSPVSGAVLSNYWHSAILK